MFQAEQHFLKHNDAGSWIQDSALMLSMNKEVPWYLVRCLYYFHLLILKVVIFCVGHVKKRHCMVIDLLIARGEHNMLKTEN